MQRRKSQSGVESDWHVDGLSLLKPEPASHYAEPKTNQTRWIASISAAIFKNTIIKIQQHEKIAEIHVKQLVLDEYSTNASKAKPLVFDLTAGISVSTEALAQYSMQLDTKVELQVKGEYSPAAGLIIDINSGPVRLLSADKALVFAEFSGMKLQNVSWHQNQLKLEQLQVPVLTIARFTEDISPIPALMQSEQMQLFGLLVNIEQQSISMNSIQFDAADITLTRQADNALLPIDYLSSRLANSSNNKPNNKTNQGWKIDLQKIILNNDSEFVFIDKTIKSAVRHDLQLDKFELANISTQLGKMINVDIQGRLNKLSVFQLQGKTDVLDGAKNNQLSATIQALDLPIYSPYLVDQLGYRIRNGQLDIKMHLERNPKHIDGELQLKLRRLKLDLANKATIKKVTAQLQIPVPTALSFLQDKQQTIQLTVPINGDPNAPDFAFNRIINLGLQRATQKAVNHYLEQTLFPYNLLYKAGKFIHKKSGQINLQPIIFTPGEGQLSESMQEYLQKLTKLLNDKSRRSLMLCGVSTTTEASDVTSGLALADQRTTFVNQQLIDAGIPAERLFLCQNTNLDDDVNAVPRIELAIQ